ncbi:hypothetical protein [Actinokineospora globicatena]|uniref:hypothetical protein n=1 Tax=Actinokineospora globicatena TaxID=103729 RepID=UPI00255599EF|nr:hypothetical protein [Actinokineospora globicatena]
MSATWTYIGIHLGLLAAAVSIVLTVQRRALRSLADIDASGLAAVVGHYGRLRELAVVRAVVKGDIALHNDGTAARLRPNSDDPLASQAAEQAHNHPDVPLLPGGSRWERGWLAEDPAIKRREAFTTAQITVTALLGVLTLASVVFAIVHVTSGAPNQTLGAYTFFPTMAAWSWLHRRVDVARYLKVPTSVHLAEDAEDADYFPIAVHGPRAWDDESAVYLLRPSR